VVRVAAIARTKGKMSQSQVGVGGRELQVNSGSSWLAVRNLHC
jgi:hypothetical protein